MKMQDRELAINNSSFAVLGQEARIPLVPATGQPFGIFIACTRVYEDVFDRSIDLQIFGSAASLRLIPSAPRTIQTERGVGFVFALPMSRSEGDWHYRRSLMAARRNVSAIRGLQGLHPSALDGRDRWVLRKGI
jgi:hypothetical protein